MDTRRRTGPGLQRPRPATRVCHLLLPADTR